jgi:hypothetical protein
MATQTQPCYGCARMRMAVRHAMVWLCACASRRVETARMRTGVKRPACRSSCLRSEGAVGAYTSGSHDTLALVWQPRPRYSWSWSRYSCLRSESLYLPLRRTCEYSSLSMRVVYRVYRACV